MLADLAIDRSARRRRFAFAAGGAAARAGGGGGLLRLQERRAGLCSGGDERLAGSLGTGRRAGAPRPRCSRPGSHTPRRWCRAWWAPSIATRACGRSSFRQACEATRVRGEQSEELLDLRMQCLDQRRSELRELVRQFEVAAPDVIERAGQAAPRCRRSPNATTPRRWPRRCARPATPPPAPAVGAVREQLARAKSLEVTGQYAAGLDDREGRRDRGALERLRAGARRGVAAARDPRGPGGRLRAGRDESPSRRSPPPPAGDTTA